MGKKGSNPRPPEGVVKPPPPPAPPKKGHVKLRLANFSILALGTRFQYKDSEQVWVKIGHDTIAKWDPTQMTTNWIGQTTCSATEDGEEIEVKIIGLIWKLL